MSLVSDIKEIAEKVLYKLDAYSDDALTLVMRTGMAESGYRTLRQMGNGPAIGFFQIEPDTINDVMDNYAHYRPHIMQDLLDLGLKQGEEEFCVLTNIALQIAFCRLCYRRVPKPIPNNLEDMAKYWKKHYNTEKGKGTVDHFKEIVIKYE